MPTKIPLNLFDTSNTVIGQTIVSGGIGSTTVWATQTAGNVNFTQTDSSITSVQSALTSTNANVATNTQTIQTLVSETFANANVSSYLSSFTGNISANNITAAQFIGNLSGTSQFSANVYLGNVTVKDNAFAVVSSSDITKKAVLSLSGLSSGTTYTYTLPAASGTLASLNTSQVFTTSQVFNGGLSSTGTVTFSGPIQNIGTFAYGGTVGIGTGATTSGNTQTINIGTGGMAGSTTNINVGSSTGTLTVVAGQMNVTSLSASGNGTFQGVVTAYHLSGNNSYTPTIAANAGAGTSPTIAIVGNDIGFKITLTTGTSPSASSAICTITFTSAYVTVPYATFSPSNAAAATAIASVYDTTSTSQFVLNSVSALAASTQYIWQVHVSQ